MFRRFKSLHAIIDFDYFPNFLLRNSWPWDCFAYSSCLKPFSSLATVPLTEADVAFPPLLKHQEVSPLSAFKVSNLELDNNCGRSDPVIRYAFSLFIFSEIYGKSDWWVLSLFLFSLLLDNRNLIVLIIVAARLGSHLTWTDYNWGSFSIMNRLATCSARLEEHRKPWQREDAEDAQVDLEKGKEQLIRGKQSWFMAELLLRFKSSRLS